MATTRQLLLLRHAKSSWDDPDLTDFDRPLSARGLKTAPLIGRELARRGWLPDMALVSPALRTRDTWRLVAAQFPAKVPTEFFRALYDASAGDILDLVRQVDNATATMLVVGHNPGLEEFARLLSGPGSKASALQTLAEKFPTAAIARFVVKGDWATLAPGSAELTHCLRPKDLG
ncbi:SixA phosphatase family protein [Mesorhizobium shangrilense]|uniref:Histidine phosphatase family protein n=1 Tax=Mesorhizobium shangrilense TaxID=460060 RepID=A0ABV2DBY2_9HYPH